MPSESSESSASRAGILITATGDRHIPSSKRADGSMRKEIRVRPGYRPPEDVEVYKNRTAQAWRTRGSAGVPGAATVGSEMSSDTSSRTAKRRDARKKAAASGEAKAVETAEEDKVRGLSNGTPGQIASTTQNLGPARENDRQDPVDPEAEKEKEAKKLAKRLRQARELKAKKEDGASLLPEQFEKVIRINELTRQLDSLGFGPDGEKKQD